MAVEEIEGHNLTVEQLLSEMHGGPFPFPKLIKMLSDCEDKEEDFLVVYGETKMKVPLHHIRAYFLSHEKPQRPMGLEEELKFLRNKVKQLEEENRQLKGDGKPGKPEKKEPEMPEPEIPKT
ncbi:MAG: hypothetical protein ACFFCW_22840, partial [Candidatus Hodarchaeota archaeon]